MRALGIVQRWRRRLGGSASLLEPFPKKPIRMHWRTYQRLRQRDQRLLRRHLTSMASESLQHRLE
jgi:hypothetical protein